MSYMQLTVKGYPDKADDRLTRVCVPIETRDAVLDIMGALAGMYWMEAKRVDELPRRDAAELARGGDLIQAGFNRFNHTH